MTAPQLQTATTDDLEGLVELARAFYDGEGYPFDQPRTRVALERILEEPSLGCVWLIDDDGRRAGYIVMTLGYSLEYGGRDAFVDELYVEPSCRRRGLASAAIDYVVEVCGQLGVRALHLEVERDNSGGQALYRKHGFSDRDRYLLTKPLIP